MKEATTPADCLKLLEMDFSDKSYHDEGTSVDERAFLQAMEEGVEVDSSQHYGLPLPFNRSKIELFDSGIQVTGGAMASKRKLTKNSEFKDSNLKQSRVHIGTGTIFGDLNFPFIGLIIVFTLVALSLGQPDDIHQRIIFATSGLLCVGPLALVMRLASYLHDLFEPSRHLNSGKAKVTGPQVILKKAHK